eukprot:scaffold69267_cov66-Phaeocystis_antarctica.AAC.1
MCNQTVRIPCLSEGRPHTERTAPRARHVHSEAHCAARLLVDAAYHEPCVRTAPPSSPSQHSMHAQEPPQCASPPRGSIFSKRSVSFPPHWLRVFTTTRRLYHRASY